MAPSAAKTHYVVFLGLTFALLNIKCFMCSQIWHNPNKIIVDIHAGGETTLLTRVQKNCRKSAAYEFVVSREFIQTFLAIHFL